MLFKLYRIKDGFKLIRKQQRGSEYCQGCVYISSLNHECRVDSNSVVGNLCFYEYMKLWSIRKHKRSDLVYHPL